MSSGFEFHPEARAEFFAEIDWYDAREAGVGERFELAVRTAIEDAVQSPDAWPQRPNLSCDTVVRSRSVSGFPYRLVYVVLDRLLTVVAVAHERRRPGYWQARIEQ